MPITPLPALDRTSATFKADVDTFFGTQIPAFVTEANALETNVNAKEALAVAAAVDTAADAIATAADAVATAADRVQTGLDVVDTAADAVATAADRVQTGLDVVAAAASAASAAAIANAFIGTSTTSWTPAVESKAFTTQAGELYTAGIFVTVVSAGTPSAYGFGQVTSYSGTTLTVDVQLVGGSGAHTDWNISLAGVRGSTGAQGIPGAGITEDAIGWHGTGGTTPKTLTVDDDLTTSQAARRNAANTFAAQQTFTEVKDTVYTIADGAAFEIDPANGSVQIVTLGASRTPAATNFEAGQTVLLMIDDGTAYTVTWTTVAPTWKTDAGSAPTLNTTGYTAILLWKVGAVMYGARVGDA